MAGSGFKSISIPDEAYNRLLELAGKEKRSMSAQATLLIDKAYEEIAQ